MADYEMKNHDEHKDNSNGTGEPEGYRHWQQPYQQPDNHFDPYNEYRNPYNPYERRNTPKKPRDAKDTYATAALIGGILSLINLCCFAFTTSIVFGVGAVSFAYLSRKERKFSKPAKIAMVLGIGGILLGVAEYFTAIQMFEMIKAPENIAQFNQMFGELEKMMESQAALSETFNH